MSHKDLLDFATTSAERSETGVLRWALLSILKRTLMFHPGTRNVGRNRREETNKYSSLENKLRPRQHPQFE